MSVNRLKIYISVDYEGLTSVYQRKEKKDVILQELRFIYDILKSNDRYWNRIKGILICDAHGSGKNISYRRLQRIDNEKTSLVSSADKKIPMLDGIEGHDLVFFVGYHAKAGTRNALIDHSYGYNIFHKVRINDKEVGETQINAYLAGEFGVKVALISGDVALSKEVGRFDPTLCFVETKQGMGRFGAQLYPLEKIKKQYADAFYRIFQCGYRGRCFKLRGNNEIKIDFLNTSMTDKASRIPYARRISGYTVKFESKVFLEIFRFLQTAALILKNNNEE